jgi:hypothetical protein
MAPPRSFRFRFTLRALLVLVTLFCVWAGYHSNRAWRERQSEAILKEYGALYGGRKLTVNMSWPQRLGESYRRMVAPLWGDRSIHSVTIRRGLEPEAAEALAMLPSLETLILESRDRYSERKRAESQGHRERRVFPPKSRMTEGALARALSNPSIRQLFLSDWILSADDCGALGAHQNLKTVEFTRCEISEEGLCAILELNRLERISFSQCDVTGAQIACVPGFPFAPMRLVQWNSAWPRIRRVPRPLSQRD